MQLLYSPMSPFARKVRVVAHEAGLGQRVEIVPVNPWTDEALRRINPLAKVPALTTDAGEPLYDSRVICRYLDHLGGGGLYPEPGQALWRAMRLEALADGIGDAAVRAVVEGRRPEGERHRDVIERQFKAIEAGLDALEAENLGEGFQIGEIAVACHLGYLDFRSVLDWRAGRPGLSAWCERVAGQDSMIATEPVQLA